MATQSNHTKRTGHQLCKPPRPPEVNCSPSKTSTQDGVLQTEATYRENQGHLTAASLAPHPYEPSRQLVYEPTSADLRTQLISELKFFRAVDACLSDNYQLTSPVELVRRLPRGGFRIQLSPVAFNKIQSSEPILQLLTFGEWRFWHSPTPTTGNSLVLNPVPLDISDSELLDELAYANTSVHDLAPAEVKTQVTAVQRLQFRHRETKELQPSRSVCLFCDKPLYEKILSRSGIFLGHRAIHTRPYTPPKYRCFKCNAVGSHKAECCHSQRFQSAPTAPNVTSSSQASPPVPTMDIDSASPSPSSIPALPPLNATPVATLPTSPASSKPPAPLPSVNQRFAQLLIHHIADITNEFPRLFSDGMSETQTKTALVNKYETPEDIEAIRRRKDDRLFPDW